MKLLALIPARGGSKRIPNKNIRCLGGKPLITWTIEAAQKETSLVDILVSTDCPEIAQVAKAAGAFVPWLRPTELATDTATSMAVCMHALDWYEDTRGPIDGLILLQPTSPFRSSKSIRSAIELFGRGPEQSVVSLSPAHSHPTWCYQITGNTLKPFTHDIDKSLRSQDLHPAYVLNGALYIASPAYLREKGHFLAEDTVPFLMSDAAEALDIDTDWDWFLAETILKQRQNSCI